MRFVSCIALAALALTVACAGRTAQDLTAEQRTPQGIFGQVCSRCHGEQGRSRAFGVSKPIATMSAQEIEEALRGYRAGTYGGAFKGVMQDQAASLTEEEIPAMAEHVASLG